MIKVKNLTIHNIGLLGNETINFDKPLLLFYGEVMAGKTTVLNAVRWCLGAPWPEDIIQHGQAEARVKLEFDGGSVERSWYAGKGGTKARDIVFIRNGAVVSKPAKEIAKLLNPFQTNQDYLRSMTEPERKAFFADLLSVDTIHLDSEAAASGAQATQLRAEIKAYGEIAPVQVPEPPNVEALRAQLDMAEEQWRTELAEYRRRQDTGLRVNADRTAHLNTRDDLIGGIATLERELVMRKERLVDCEQWLAENPLWEVENQPTEPTELTELRTRISEAGAAVERWKAAQRDQARLATKLQAEKDLAALEARQREIKEEKAKLLKGYAEKCGVPGLAFDDEGCVVFEGTTAGMLSTSQLMRLSSALAALYPPGFGLDLIDRAESLGKSIFDFIDRAKAGELTILATVVGEAPAKSPPEVGVFVVEKGKIKQQK